jgi:ABC-2 type transport system ATP-binding protein
MNFSSVPETTDSTGSRQTAFQGSVLHLEDISVSYRVPTERIGTFKEYVIRRAKRQVHMRTFWALKGVNLDVNRGEVLGIVGNNGAGKSTMLKVVARVLRPTRGRVVVKGRVAPLLELGAGFHLELTGKENIFLNSAMLGFSQRETLDKYDEIVEFSELKDFIGAPLRTYSTGMFARLGFAVATACDPDILLLDEILSVGDENFQKKCNARIRMFQERGAAIILVSHNMGKIQEMTQRAAWLDHGEVRAVGSPEKVIQEYRAGGAQGNAI